VRTALGVNPTKQRPVQVDYKPQEKTAVSSPGITEEIKKGTIDPEKLHSLIPNSPLLKNIPQFDESVDQSFDFTKLTSDLKSIQGPTLEEVFTNSQKKNQKMAMQVQREEENKRLSDGDVLDVKMNQTTTHSLDNLERARKEADLLTRLDNQSLQSHIEQAEDLRRVDEHSASHNDLEHVLSVESTHLDNSHLSDSLSESLEDKHDDVEMNDGLVTSNEMQNELHALETLEDQPDMSEKDLEKLEHLSSESEVRHNIDSNELEKKSHNNHLETTSHNTDLEDQSMEQDTRHQAIHQDPHHQTLENKSQRQPIDEHDLPSDTLENTHNQMEDRTFSPSEKVEQMRNNPDLQNSGLDLDSSPEDLMNSIEEKMANGDFKHQPELRAQVEQLLKAQKEFVESRPPQKRKKVGLVKFKPFMENKFIQKYNKRDKNGNPFGIVQHSQKTNSLGQPLGEVTYNHNKHGESTFNPYVNAHKRTNPNQYNPIGSQNMDMIKVAKVVKRAKLDKMARHRHRLINKYLKI
jgi:hypothetical protein